MKKSIAVLFSFFIVLSTSACGQSTASSNDLAVTNVAATLSSTSTYIATQVPSTQTPILVPTNTSLPSATTTSQVGSYEHPIPFKTPMRFLKDNNKELTMEVTEVRGGQEAWDMLYTADPLNKKGPSNMEWMCSMVHIEYKSGPSGEPIEMAVFMFHTVSSGLTLEIPYYVSPQPEYNISVLPGGVGEGWVCGHYRKNGTNPMLLFGHTNSTSGWYFSLTP